MTRWTVVIIALMFVIISAMGCSSGGVSPVTPTASPETTSGTDHQGQAQTHLWGYYDIYVDTQALTAEVVFNHSGAFTANVVSFLNSNPAGIGVTGITTDPKPGVMNVELDVSITHPLNLVAYDGYDVRGVFVGNGGKTMTYQGLKVSKLGTDQMLVNSDGYSRWFNPTEFTVPGTFGYTPGAIATKGYTGTAKLNPYKYFADTLTAKGDLWDFINGPGNAKNGLFSHGKTNTRHYELAFPIPAPGVKFGYAVLANWKGELPTDHPSNAVEALAISTIITPDIYYINGTDNGGDLKLDLSVFDWGSALAESGVMEEYGITIEGEVFTPNYIFTPTDLTPIAETDTYFTYRVKVPANHVTYNSNGAGHDSDFWVIVEYPGANYKNDYGVPNGVGNDPLAAFFRVPLYIHDQSYNSAPTIISGVDGNATPIEMTVETYSVDAFDEDGDPITYTWTVKDGDGIPVAGYDMVPGDGAGNLDIDWGEVAGTTWEPAPFSVECQLSDGINPPVDATPLDCEVWIEIDWYVSNNPDFDGSPKYGTQEFPFATINQALAFVGPGETIAVDYGTGTYSGQVNRSNNPDALTLRGWSWYTQPGGRPKLTANNASILYIYYSADVTVQGFHLEIYPGTGSSGYQPIYIYYSSNVKLIDCKLSGTISYYYLYAVYSYYSTITIKNCLFTDLQTDYSSSYRYVYFYLYRDQSSPNYFLQNEITKIQDTIQVPGYMYIYFYCYYWPNGSRFSNNLEHHIAPNCSSYFYNYGIPRMYYPYNSVEVSNNTLDTWTNDKASNSSSNYTYGMYLYASSSSYAYDAHSNIVSNLTGTNTMPTYYGIYDYTLPTDYNDVWNVQDYQYYWNGPGPNSISADPLYVNNTTAPYDYHLDSGSPCIGEGKNGNDMGCYGNLPAGETKVGLLTPE